MAGGSRREHPEQVSVEFLERDFDGPGGEDGPEPGRRRMLRSALAVLAVAVAAAAVLLTHDSAHAPVRAVKPSPPWLGELAVKARLALGPGYQVLNGVGCPQVGTAELQRRVAATVAMGLPAGRMLELQPAIDKMGGLCGVELRARMPGASVVVVAQALRAAGHRPSVRLGRLGARSAASVHEQAGRRWSVDVGAIGRRVPPVAALERLGTAVARELQRATASGHAGRRHAP